MIEVLSVEPELPKSLIVYTYIEDQPKKINRLFGQMTLTRIWWLYLTSLSSLLIKLHTSLRLDPPTAGFPREFIGVFHKVRKTS